MKKVLSVVLALLMLCASILVAFAATTRFSIIRYFCKRNKNTHNADFGLSMGN